MDKAQLKTLDVKSLNEEIENLRKELFNLHLTKKTGQIKDVSQFKKLRAQIARALTCLNEKKAKRND